MIVLKDIKVSKTRIPVQNALWLRPIDKETYKIYYPSGGNWKEIVFETSEDMDNTLEPRVEALEEAMKQANVDISGIRKSLEDFQTAYYRAKSNDSTRLNALADRVTILEKNFDTIVGLMMSQVTSVNVADEFSYDANEGTRYSRAEMADFGFTELVFRSIYSKYCKKAFILGDAYTIRLESLEAEPADLKPGYGEKIVFVGAENIVGESDNNESYHEEYAIVPYYSYVNNTLVCKYEITKRTVSSNESGVIEIDEPGQEPGN